MKMSTFPHMERTAQKMLLLLLMLVAVKPSSAQVTPPSAVSNPRIVEHPEDQYVARTEPATLNCKAEGDPTPVITWYRDGQQVVTANENPSSHRMLLPSGQLFFLRVIHNKNSRPDVGTYYCNATNPETKVSVISRSAKLEIAVIRDEFREPPQSNDIALGSTATISCRAPRGEPEPRIRWKKDGEPLEVADRIVADEYGSLTIRQAHRDDAGSYVCVAYNVAGERESLPALINIREKPVIINGPKDLTVAANSDVVLQCQATGDPAPAIMWKKREGQIPAERSRLLADHSLRIERVQISDDGVYVCQMENPFGSEEAEARLSIHSRPSFVVKPTDKVVGVGRRLSIKCVVTGSPQPAVYWSKKSSQNFLFPNQNNGRFHVLEDGTLIIDSIRREDAGEYSCQALSMAGSVSANIRIEVKDSDQRPPPIIYHGPQNQTLPTEGQAVMSCLAGGDPAPSILWLKGRSPIPAHDPRIAVRDSGALEISDLRITDTAVYTCKAVSETGETSWSAGLIVEPPLDPSIVFHRTPESTTFPGAPSQPILSDVTESSIRLSWKPHVNPGASPVTSYVVEYFSHDSGEGWTVASNSVSETSYTVRNLLPNTSYMFLVRALNSHGLSLPSPVTSVVRTRGESVRQRPTVPSLDVSIVTEKLSGQIINMHTPEVLTSTAVKLTWELRRNQAFVEGFYIKYRVASDLENEGSGSPRSGRMYSPQSDYTVVTVLSPSATLYVLSDLQKFTWYEMRIQPFYGTVKGTESNLFRIRTLPDRPSAPPQNIRTAHVENDTLLLSWEPPAKQHRNGILTGYKLLVIATEPKRSKEIPVNVSTESYYLRNLVKDVTYRLQMLAYNEIGDGPPSEPIIIGHQPSEAKNQLINEPWFIATLISIVGAAVWIVLCVFSVWIYRRHKAGKKIPKNRAKPVPVHMSADAMRSAYTTNQMPLLATNVCNGSQLTNQPLPYINGSYRGNQARLAPCCYDNESPSDGDSKATGSLVGHTYQTLESLQQHNDVTANGNQGFYNRSAAPTMPYASTTPQVGGISNGRTMPSTGCIPNPQAYMIQPAGSINGCCPKDGCGLDPRNEQACYSAAGTQPRLFLPPPPDLSEHGTLPPDNYGRSGFDDPVHDDGYGMPPAYSELRQLNYPVDRSGYPADRFVDATPVLTDPRLLDYDTYTDCNVTDAEMPVESMLVDAPESDADSLSRCSSEHSLNGVDNFADVLNQALELQEQHNASFHSNNDQSQKGRRPARHRQRAARPSSPYSTDSNYSAAAAQQPRRPYPKSERRKQLAAERGGSGADSSSDARRCATGVNNFTGSPHNTDRFRSVGSSQSKPFQNGPDQSLLFTKPPVPYSTANSSRSSHGSGVPASSIRAPLAGDNDSSNGSRPNPLSAFDMHDTPIV